MGINKLPDGKDLELLRTRMATQFQLPSAYDDALSYQGLIYKLIQYLKDTMQNVEDWNNWLEDFVGTFDKRLQDTVREKVQDLYDSGQLAELTADVIEVVQNQIDGLEDSLNDIKSNMVYANVKYYGAKGDGISDDTIALQNVFNNYNSIFIPNGVYIVRGKNVLELRDGMRIEFESPEAIIKVADDQGDWNSILYSETLVEDIVIKNGTIDCNINNYSVTDTNAWIEKGRVPIRIMFGKNILIDNMNFITNGWWTIRGHWIDSTIRNCLINFDVNTNGLANYDSSAIWLGGRDNKIINNTLITNSKIVNGNDVRARTAFEIQGHRTLLDSNSVYGFTGGVIVTNSTAYYYPELNTPQGGNDNSIISNNRFIECQSGVNIWTMNTPFENPELNNLIIQNNFIKLKQHDANRASRGIFSFRPSGSMYGSGSVANGEQNGSVKNLTIKGNVIERVDRSQSAVLDLTPTVDYSGTCISNNIIRNSGANAIRAGHFTIPNDNGVIVDNNDTFTRDMVIKENVFEDCYRVLYLERNVVNVLFTDNTIRQTKVFEMGQNCVMPIRHNDKTKLVIARTTLDFPDEVKPFIPNQPNAYYNYGNIISLDKFPRTIHEIGNYQTRVSDIQTVNRSQAIVRLDGRIQVSGSGFGTTVGTQSKEITVLDYKVNTSNTPSYLDVDSVVLSDMKNVEPYVCLASDVVVSELNVFPVIAVEMNRLYLGYHPTFTGEIKGRKLVLHNIFTNLTT